MLNAKDTIEGKKDSWQILFLFLRPLRSIPGCLSKKEKKSSTLSFKKLKVMFSVVRNPKI